MKYDHSRAAIFPGFPSSKLEDRKGTWTYEKTLRTHSSNLQGGGEHTHTPNPVYAHVIYQNVQDKLSHERKVKRRTKKTNLPECNEYRRWCRLNPFLVVLSPTRHLPPPAVGTLGCQPSKNRTKPLPFPRSFWPKKLSLKPVISGLNPTNKKILRILTKFSDLWKFPQIFKMCSYQNIL